MSALGGIPGLPLAGFAEGEARPRPRGGLLFDRRFTAGDRATRSVLADMVRVLGAAGIEPDDISNTELILAEMLNNLAEHAYGDAAGPVALTVAAERTGLRCAIADRGRPLPFGTVPDPGPPAIDPPDHLPEGGFGWHIIRCLACDFAYRRQGDWNRLSMRVPWSGFD